MLVVDFWKFMIQNCVSFSPSILSIRWIKIIVPKHFLKVENFLKESFIILLCITSHENVCLGHSGSSPGVE